MQCSVFARTYEYRAGEKCTGAFVGVYHTRQVDARHLKGAEISELVGI